MLLLLVAQALADDVEPLRVDATVGAWLGDSTGTFAFGGGVGWQRGTRIVEFRHTELRAFCFGSCWEDNMTRTSVLVGRRWAWTRDGWMAAADLAAGVGGGPDRSYAASSPVAVGAVGLARVSAGTPTFGVEALAMPMVGNAPFDVEVSCGLYVGMAPR